MKSQRPKIEAIRNPTLFEMEKLEEAGEPTSEPGVERPFSLPGILLGTSSFTAAGWEGSFYPQGMRSRDFLSYYASQFQTVEVDSTFYGTPSVSTVTGWNQKTPRDFIFAVRVPQVITHDKVLGEGERFYTELNQRGISVRVGLEATGYSRWFERLPAELRNKCNIQENVF